MGVVNTQVVTSSGDLQEVFQKSQQTKTPVYLYRDKPVSEGIILDLSKWNKIEQFDVDNLMVIVEPGLLLKDLNFAAAAHGLRFIPADSPAYCNLSVGEWAYRGCPNISAWKYGAGKHFLLGASYVLPNGDITPVGGKCIKNVTGYDFTRFLTGPYADLAVGVRYIIKLMPQPAFRIAYNLEFVNIADAIKLVHILQTRTVPPAWLFWLDKTVGQKLGNQCQDGHRILFELDGNEAEVREYAQAINAILDDCNAKTISEDTKLPDLGYIEQQRNEFWLLDEFKVPYTEVAQFAVEVERLLKEEDSKGGLFGQLADGKIHLYIEGDRPNIGSHIRAIQDVAKYLGGAATGKYQRLHSGGPTGKMAELERAFKKRLDPAGIFNRPEEAII